jgi:hypothetical protein
MDGYTKDDAIQALKNVFHEPRTRVFVDQRSYLIGILAYRFMMTEHQIATAVGIKRDMVNYNKRLAIQFQNDKAYNKNVYVYAQMFPFDFSSVEKYVRTGRAVRVELDLERKLYNKLKAAGSILGHKDIRTTIKLFLEKSLKLWEE